MAQQMTQEQAAQLAQFRQQQAAVNNKFLTYALEKPVAGAVLNGNTFTASGPASLKYTLSGINGGWLRRVRIQASGSLTYTAATSSPTCTINAVGIDGLFSGIKQTYGSGYKPTSYPFILRLLSLLRGYNRSTYTYNPSISDDVADIKNALCTTTFTPGSALTAGSNPFVYTLDLPLQAIHPNHPSGILPVDTTGTVYTLEILPNLTQLVGTDPLLNFVNTNGTVVWGSTTITVTFYYSDGESVTYTQILQPNMAAIPSAEYAEVTDQPLYANQFVVQQLQLALPIARIISIVIDGNSSSQFAQVATLDSPSTGVQQYAILKGANISDAFRSYDQTNGGLPNYYADFRNRYGIDLPAGVFVYDALGAGVTNPSNQNGLAYWDTSNGVWAASRVGINVASVGSNGNPRIVTSTIVQNPAGIIK